MKTSILVGGQAVIEGVMMRVPGAYATALRLKNGEIISRRSEFKSIIETRGLKNCFIIRGMIHLYESMKIGYQTLNWSALVFEKENNHNNEEQASLFQRIMEYFSNIFAIIFAISLFILLPLYITNILMQDSNQAIYFNIISGFVRITIFLLYLITISQLNDVKRLFQYHGAEHKTVYNFESGENLSAQTAQKFSTKHPRCGTSFLFIIMLVTIFSYTILDSIALLFLDNLTVLVRFLLHLACLPLVAGIGYEVLKFLASKQHILFFKLLSKPGLWLQNITTKQPDNKQVDVAIYALREAFGEKLEEYLGKEYNAESIG
tara:strand:+ start:788 stop:1744 length:957 start_codon:yes stop_codon:yes gene_type:complete